MARGLPEEVRVGQCCHIDTTYVRTSQQKWQAKALGSTKGAARGERAEVGGEAEAVPFRPCSPQENRVCSEVTGDAVAGGHLCATLKDLPGQMLKSSCREN